MATNAANIKFYYVGHGSVMPASPDANGIYFLEDAKKLYVGANLIADHTNIAIGGDAQGDYIASASFANDTLTLTKGTLPTLSKGSDTSGTPITLQPGNTFTVMTDTSVSGHTISDQNTAFTLPAGISNVVLSASDGVISGVINWTDNTSTPISAVTVFTPSDYMQATGGTATNATITLASAPTASMSAATKGYVDEAVGGLSGAMHFLGQSSTAITNGGTETPTIDGQPVTPKSGDVVLYDGLEFVWDGTHWIQLGDESSYALKTVSVSGSGALTGTGTLASDIVIEHVQNLASSGSVNCDASAAKIEMVTSLAYDEYGHLSAVPSKTDITSAIQSIASTVASSIVSSLDYSDTVSGDYVTSVTEADGVIALTKGTKGTIDSSSTGLVDGSTVYSAIQDAAVSWILI